MKETFVYINKQNPALIPEIALLADEIWHEHFAEILSASQVDYMVERFQSVDAVTRQINDENYVYVAAVFNGSPVGFVAYRPVSDKRTLFLSKLYLHKTARGHGLGRALIQTASDVCRIYFGYTPQTLRLHCNKNNTGSLNAYGRMGFKNTGSVVTDIGGGFVMDDFEMTLDLSGGETKP